jgi:hypothetical protein
MHIDLKFCTMPPKKSAVGKKNFKGQSWGTRKKTPVIEIVIQAQKEAETVTVAETESC